MNRTHTFTNPTNTANLNPLHVVAMADGVMDDTPGEFWRDIKSAVTLTARAFTREGRRRANGSLCMVGRMFEAAATAMRW